ncbi:hypothetical protein [Belliella pelovolcani]|jgi:hypothetical protein|uniref:DUF2116 family Zn-ribbon domain-containing protein n=1 Tax=Belliella pelovolcani TaxID=529505 RepID=A0A1N7P768_9BACT|nr:hypothetical protein [Belliella pelovolcani]SIT06299.1 hypothetical protein SAMN05421761_11466 [Belliella pelovolcani]
MIIEKRYCKKCNEPIYGRSDKVFCDDGCRNAYNNIHRKETNDCVVKIYKQLRLNRKILEKIYTGGVGNVRVPRNKMLKLGYNFLYLTNFQVDYKGDQYEYCFDYGYLVLDKDWVLVVKDMFE